MIVCQCNVVTQNQVRDVIVGFLEDDPWQLIVPNKVLHELNARGQCCGCYPELIGLIISTTKKYNEEKHPDRKDELQSLVMRLEEINLKLSHGRRRQAGRLQAQQTGNRA